MWSVLRPFRTLIEVTDTKLPEYARKEALEGSMPLLSEMVGLWADDMKEIWKSPKDARDRPNLVRQFIELVGDLPMDRYRKKHAREYKKRVLKQSLNTE